MRVLLTSTSFLDTPGKHQELLKMQGYNIEMLRGPISEAELLPVIGKYEAVICGDDEYTRRVLEKGRNGKLRYISKYGVGLDKIDLIAATELGIPVANCPGVNQVSVAEHVFALLLSFARNIHLEYNITKAGKWERFTGTEIYGKTLGIAGLGSIGKEVAKRAIAFGLEVVAYDPFMDTIFAKKNNIRIIPTFDELVNVSDILTFHMPQTPETLGILNRERIEKITKPGIIIINTSRGRLVDLEALINGLRSGKIKGYLTDVLDIEPMPNPYLLKDLPNVLITPHIASRTNESVERQGVLAVSNLIDMIQIQPDLSSLRKL